MNCANCSNEALYVYEGSGVRKVVYCPSCLPSFLQPLAKAGLLPTTEAFNTIKERVMTQLIPSTVLDEPVEEISADVYVEYQAPEKVTEEAKPTRKRKRSVKPVTEQTEILEEV